VARHRRGVSINDYANTLRNSRDTIDRQIELYLQALRYWPENRVFLGNLAVARAWKAYYSGDYERALSFQRRAQSLGARNTAANIAHLEHLLAVQSGDVQVALAKAKRAADLAPNNQKFQAVFHDYQAKILRKAEQSEQKLAIGGACPFGKCNPSPQDSGIESTPSKADENRAQAARAHQAFDQASSELENLRNGLGGCVYDNGGKCLAGAVQPYSLAGRSRATRKAVFPALLDSDWEKLQSSRAGRDLIKEADSLRIRQQAAWKELGDIKNGSAPYKEKAQQMIAVNETLEKLGKEIGGMQAKAEQIFQLDK